MIDEAVATEFVKTGLSGSKSPSPQLSGSTGQGHERSLKSGIVYSYQAEPGSTVVIAPHSEGAGAPMKRKRWVPSGSSSVGHSASPVRLSRNRGIGPKPRLWLSVVSPAM